MPTAFKDLGKPQQEAVNAYVQNEYDVLVFQQPTSYVSRNAQNDPDGWRERLRDLIAVDLKRVEGITRAHELKQRGVAGFTLIELSIVLVIVGLIVGGVLVGRDLIKAAEVRSQIAQIEKFKTAANTFFEKYGYLPGDIPPNAIAQTGLTVQVARAGAGGSGDGNGELDGNTGNTTYAWNQSGETVFFWEDLVSARLIEGGFTAATGQYGGADCTSNLGCSQFLPYSKLNNGSFVYVYSGYAANCCASSYGLGPNFFGISMINSVSSGNVSSGSIPPGPALTVS